MFSCVEAKKNTSQVFDKFSKVSLVNHLVLATHESLFSWKVWIHLCFACEFFQEFSNLTKRFYFPKKTLLLMLQAIKYLYFTNVKIWQNFNALDLRTFNFFQNSKILLKRSLVKLSVIKVVKITNNPKSALFYLIK